MEYRQGSGNGGGVQVVHGTVAFTPAVPQDARVLRISSGSRPVDLSL